MIMAGALCLSSVVLVNAKSYEIQITAPATLGSIKLPAGDYKVKVEGTNAVLTDVAKNKTYTAPVKIETEDKKFDQTAVVTDNSDGANHIKAIEVGGSNTKLDFGE